MVLAGVAQRAFRILRRSQPLRRPGWALPPVAAFGAVTVSPWFSFGLDVGVLLLLGVLPGRDALERQSEESNCTAAEMDRSRLQSAWRYWRPVSWDWADSLARPSRKRLPSCTASVLRFEQATVDLGVGQNGEWKTA